MQSNFEFAKSQWPGVYRYANRAEVQAKADPRAACWYSRLALEEILAWLYDHDTSLQRPFDSSVHALLHEPTLKALLPQAVWLKARQIQQLGNKAAHNNKPVQQIEAVMAVASVFHLVYWVARTYGLGEKPGSGLQFNEELLPTVALVHKESLDELRKVAAQAAAAREQLEAERAGNAVLQEQLEQLQQSLAAAKAAAVTVPDAHDYKEDETRRLLIDGLLNEAGWPLEERGRDTEFAVTLADGKPGFADYVLWGADGKPLGVVEAKRTAKDARAGKEQAVRYADALESQFGQRPVIFYSNGYESWLWDDLMYSPRRVNGFYTPEELLLLVQRRGTRKSLGDAVMSEKIADRYYQTRAIRRVCETFEVEKQRKALLVMATGSGKTRTVIGLADVLMRANWAKRVLFLADRNALVNQAINAFKRHLPEAAPVNLVTDKSSEGRVYASTYPTMLSLLDEVDHEGRRRFGPGFFDLIVIDEAHRSIFRKYRAILEHFDAPLVGLTATPKDEVDRSTYKVFELQAGMPTDSYSLEQAVADGYLVPFVAVRVPTKFVREGIRYDDLSPDEQEQWDELEWVPDDTGTHADAAPHSVDAAAVNTWLFNADTVDKVLAHLMTHGHKVAGGDRLAKTIIFAKSQRHAEFIVERFDAQYPHLKGSFARAITSASDSGGVLLDKFTDPSSDPHLAVSVDMLDTGVDVPEVANLVFFKIVRSKTKFWQMIGRGTRLCPDLYGPGRDKKDFRIFDVMGNFDFFGANPEIADPKVAPTVTERTFMAQIDLVEALNPGLPEIDIDIQRLAHIAAAEPDSDQAVRDAAVARLALHTAAVPLDNIAVRPHRELVEQYAKPSAWQNLSMLERERLNADLAPLPAALPRDREEAKRFDLLVYRTQLALLEGSGEFDAYRKKIQAIGAALEAKTAIPMVNDQLDLILALSEDTWWQGMTVAILENLRRKMRGLVQFLDAQRMPIIYSDFEDDLQESTLIDPGIIPAADADGVSPAFRAKTTQFLFEHLDHPALVKLHTGEQLTSGDVEALEKILVDSATASPGQLATAAEHAGGLGLFIRSLVGLDRTAAKEMLSQALQDRTPTGDQIEFLNLIVDSLTEQGHLSISRLYESPFVDLANGPEDLFDEEEIQRINDVLDEVLKTAQPQKSHD